MSIQTQKNTYRSIHKFWRSFFLPMLHRGRHMLIVCRMRSQREHRCKQVLQRTRLVSNFDSYCWHFKMVFLNLREDYLLFIFRLDGKEVSNNCWFCFFLVKHMGQVTLIYFQKSQGMFGYTFIGTRCQYTVYQTVESKLSYSKTTLWVFSLFQRMLLIKKLKCYELILQNLEREITVT